MDRRNFIGKSAIAAGAFTLVPGHVVARDPKGKTAPGDRINLGFIGVGKQSQYLLSVMAKCPETMMLAGCDVDTMKLARFKKDAEKANSEKLDGGNQKVDTYENYRDLLGRNDIDAVVIAVPDHWHAMIAVDAAKAGKDIYGFNRGRGPGNGQCNTEIRPGFSDREHATFLEEFQTRL